MILAVIVMGRLSREQSHEDGEVPVIGDYRLRAAVRDVGNGGLSVQSKKAPVIFHRGLQIMVEPSGIEPLTSTMPL
jgi:hypothetical protein